MVDVLTLAAEARRRGGLFEFTGRLPDGGPYAVVMLAPNGAEEVPRADRLATHLGLLQMQMPHDAFGKTVQDALVAVITRLLTERKDEA